ncbi:MAG: glycosyl hydrolase family 18 protein [Microgenomates group bacterium]
MKRFIGGLVIILLIIGGIFFQWQKDDGGDLLTPLGLGNIFQRKEDKKMETVGFLPSWMIGKTKIYGKEIDQLIFSGIEVNTDGSLVWDIQSKKINNESYLQIKKSVKQAGGKNILSIKMFDDNDLKEFMADEVAKKNLINNVREVVISNGYDGVNIDFEYMSDNQRILADDFVRFFADAKKGGWGEIGVDVFANTIIKGSKERLEALNGVVDWIVVMAYDFHRPGADYAGPVAPIGSEVGERNVREIVDKMAIINMKAEKIIMAYPLYGYEWATVDESWGSAQLAGRYGRTVFFTESIGFTGTKFDELSMTPWVAWEEKIQKSKVKSKKIGKRIVKTTEYYYVNEWHQAYFEDERSLKLKVELAKNAKVGGIGFWALGYEGINSDLITNLKLQSL